jgi:hypothetical protein
MCALSPVSQLPLPALPAPRRALPADDTGWGRS